MTIELIVGLQNPGSAYAKTRHNVGGWLVEALVQEAQAEFNVEKKLHALLASIVLGQRPLKCALPLTYMNQSGLALRSLSQFYRIEVEKILVVHDDLDLAPGRIKLKSGGGHGGHNGLKDIIQHLGSSQFQRLRIGIGHPGYRDQVLDYVLSKPRQEEKSLIDDAIRKGIDALPILLEGDINKAMNVING